MPVLSLSQPPQRLMRHLGFKRGGRDIKIEKIRQEVAEMEMNEAGNHQMGVQLGALP